MKIIKKHFVDNMQQINCLKHNISQQKQSINTIQRALDIQNQVMTK